MRYVWMMILVVMLFAGCDGKDPYEGHTERDYEWELDQIWVNGKCPYVDAVLRIERGLGSARAYIEYDKLIIAYDPDFLKTRPLEYQRHAFYHECAHHTLQHLHVGTDGPKKEREAECMAAQQDVREGMTPGQIGIVIKETEDYVGSDRAATVLHCASEAMKLGSK